MHSEDRLTRRCGPSVSTTGPSTCGSHLTAHEPISLLRADPAKSERPLATLQVNPSFRASTLQRQSSGASMRCRSTEVLSGYDGRTCPLVRYSILSSTASRGCVQGNCALAIHGIAFRAAFACPNCETRHESPKATQSLRPPH